MSTEENKVILRRIPEELFNQGNLAVVDEVFADDYVDHHPLPPDFPRGHDGLKRFVTGLRTAFSDFRYTVEDAIAEGDKVVLRLTARGTHSGAWELLPVPPTGKQATWSEIHIVRMADGKLVEHWLNADQLGLLQQLGAIPAPGQA